MTGGLARPGAALIVLLALAAGFWAYPQSASSGTPTLCGVAGDVSGDDTVDARDATLILQFDAGLLGALTCQQDGDVTHDGAVNALDATLVLQFTAGLLGNLSDSLLEDAIARGFVTIGIANEAPFGFLDEEGNATGAAPAVAREVFRRLGIPEVRAETVSFGALIPDLRAGRFDMMAAGMFITPERANVVLFSDPDYCATEAFAVGAGNPLGITRYENVAANPAARLGVLIGALQQAYADEAGVAPNQLHVFQRPDDMFDALLDGRIDAAAFTSIFVHWRVQQLGDPSIEATQGFVPVIDGEEQFGCGAYGFRHENQEFRDAFNDVLAEMKENGEILPIVEPFGYTAPDIELARDLTLEDLVGP